MESRGQLLQLLIYRNETALGSPRQTDPKALYTLLCRPSTCAHSYSLRLTSYYYRPTHLHRHQAGAYTASGRVSNSPSPMSEPRSLERWRLGRSLEPGFWQPWQLALSLPATPCHWERLILLAARFTQITSVSRPGPSPPSTQLLLLGARRRLGVVASGSGTWPAGDGAAAGVRCIYGEAFRGCRGPPPAGLVGWPLSYRRDTHYQQP